MRATGIDGSVNRFVFVCLRRFACLRAMSNSLRVFYDISIARGWSREFASTILRSRCRTLFAAIGTKAVACHPGHGVDLKDLRPAVAPGHEVDTSPAGASEFGKRCNSQCRVR